ncbi:MAG: hypothetical protein GX083_04210 [Clostridiales bacterium]|nr:hypothetical protein [Clostridiales bacterium]
MKEDKLTTLIGFLLGAMALMSFSVGRVIMGGIFALFTYVVFHNRGKGNINERSIYENEVKSDLTIQELYDKFKDMNTPFGKPWLAEHENVPGEIIVFGPNTLKDSIIISKQKGKINIKHTLRVDYIKRKPEDEYRFGNLMDIEGVEVTPEKYSIFASYKLIAVTMLRHLREMIEKMTATEDVQTPAELDIFDFYYHNAHNGWFFDAEGRKVLKVENSFIPFMSKVSDVDGNVMAEVIPHGFDPKGRAKDSAGYELMAEGEHYAEINKGSHKGRDYLSLDTPSGKFEITSFPACRRANVGCNYTITLDGKLKAVIGGSSRLIFDGLGRQQNDVILSFDDNYLVMYAIIEVLIMTINKRYLK